MFSARRSLFEVVWAKLGECRACRRGALLGAILGWFLIGLVFIAGDRQQLSLAAVLSVLGLTALWGLHRIALAIKMRPTPQGERFGSAFARAHARPKL
jgi:hypothetical protein